MRDNQPAHPTRLVQVAKRKQKPLGQEDLVVRKRSKNSKSSVSGEVEALDEHDAPKIFISPEKYLANAKCREDDGPREFVSPLKDMELADENEERSRAGHNTRSKKKGDYESSSMSQTHKMMPKEAELDTGSSDNRPNSSQQPPHFEKPDENPSDRFVTSAQEDLLQMIDEGASDLAIENQLKIIKMLRARLHPQGESPVFPYLVLTLLLTVTKAVPQNSSTEPQEPKEQSKTKDLTQTLPKSSKSKPAPRHPQSNSSNSSSRSSYSQPTPSPRPKRSKRRPRRITAAQANTSRETKGLLETARPVSAPTFLPASQRTNKTLTTKKVAQLSKPHPTFDEASTNRFDRHTRKINSTYGMASNNRFLQIPNDRELENRIRAPTESSSSEGERAANARRGGGLRLDSANLRAASTAAAAAAAADGASSGAGAGAKKGPPGRRPLFMTGKPTATNEPERRGNGGDTSPRELEGIVLTLNASLAARTGRLVPPATPTTAAVGSTNAAFLARGRAVGQGEAGSSSATARQWPASKLVEELDTDED